jgi:Domain of unknown function (DUF4386)
MVKSLPVVQVSTSFDAQQHYANRLTRISSGPHLAEELELLPPGARTDAAPRCPRPQHVVHRGPGREGSVPETPPALSVNLTARLAGAIHLATLPLGYFGLVYAPRVLAQGVEAGLSASTAAWFLRAGTVSDVVGQVLFAIAVLLLFDVFRPFGRRLAASMLMLALLGVPIACLAEVQQVAAAESLRGAAHAALLTATERDQVSTFLAVRGNGLQIAELFWGLWLLPLSALVYRSGIVPRLIAPLLGIAAMAYLADWSFGLLRPDLTLPVHYLFSLELSLPLWLVIRGVDRQRWAEGVGSL